MGCLWQLGAAVALCGLATAAVPLLGLDPELASIFAFLAGFALLSAVLVVVVPTGKVREARGRLEVVVDRAEVTAHKHFLAVGEVSFRADRELTSAFEHGAPYAIYYNEATKAILSYERLAGPPAGAPAAPAPAADRLAALEDLRARGLITDAEYAAKRAEILASL